MDSLNDPMILFAVLAAAIFVVARLLNRGPVATLGSSRLGGVKMPPPGRHEIVIADPINDFPEADTDFYNRMGQELAKAGFSWVGYFEDRTISRLNPRARSFSAAFVNADGTVMALVHERRRAGSGGRSDYFTGLFTEFTNGEFLVSSLTGGTVPEARTLPGLTAQSFGPDTPLRRVLYEHDTAAGKLLHAGDNITERPARTLADVIESQHRLLAVIAGLAPASAVPAVHR